MMDWMDQWFEDTVERNLRIRFHLETLAVSDVQERAAFAVFQQVVKINFNNYKEKENALADSFDDRASSLSDVGRRLGEVADAADDTAYFVKANDELGSNGRSGLRQAFEIPQKVPVTSKKVVPEPCAPIRPVVVLRSSQIRIFPVYR